MREAEQQRIWRQLGFSTALEYLEDVFGYCPRTAKDRLRVAKALGELPALEDELRRGALPYSAARELTRVMTGENESEWLQRVRGKNVNDIHAMVRGRKKGDSPDTPTDPALMLRDVVFRLDPRRDALLQQARAMFERERGEYLDEAALLEALCLRALEPVAASHDKPPRPAHQIVVRRCECLRAWQEARGALVEISARDRELAECDAEVTHEDELTAAAAAGVRPPKPTLTIPAPIRKLVWKRDGGRCRFPGCRARRNLAVHHLVHQAHGGGHEPSNLIVLCDGHHKLLHDGIISIRGRAPDELVFERSGRRLVDSRAPTEIRAAPGRATKGSLDGADEDCAQFVATSRSDNHSAAHRAPSHSEGSRYVDEVARVDQFSQTSDARSHLDEVAHMEQVKQTSKARSRFADVARKEQAKQALKQMGFKAGEARRAVEEASALVGAAGDLNALVKAALAVTRRASSDADGVSPT